MSCSKTFSYKHLLLPGLLALLLSACGGDTGPGTGYLTLGITDGPVDHAEHVYVKFSTVEVKPAEGRSYVYDFGVDQFGEPVTRTIDLYGLQSGLRDVMIEGEPLPAGRYEWIRLGVHATADGILDSYIVIDGASYELYVPSGAQTGLKINTPFQIIADIDNDYTIDFDLRKSVHDPRGQTMDPYGQVYFLRPTLRLVRTMATGSIAGQLDPIVFEGQTCSDPLSYAVYVYAGTVATPYDIDGQGDEPVTTASVDTNNGFSYRAAYLEPGTYTVAATCQADLDQPDQADPEVVFVGTAQVVVEAGQETPHDIP